MPKTWEELCRRCGQCCFEKWLVGNGEVRFTRIPCRHLDIVERTCRVYDKRLEMGEGCVALTPENVPTYNWLPSDCAYVEFLLGQKAEPKRKRGRRSAPHHRHD